LIWAILASAVLLGRPAFCAEFAETIEIAEEALLAFGLASVLWLL
jgi:hypothetical protein